jgi:hypothetical protein
MSQITIGEVEWDAVTVPGENRGDRVSDFMQLKQGDNRGRVLSNPQQFAVHWVVDETGKKRKVGCAAAGCPVCMRGQDGDKPQARWMIKFFNREENRVQLLEISSQILKGVLDLVKNPDWGPVTEYDITVKRAAPGSQPLYTVMPGRRAPLTGEEKQALAVFNERVKIEKFIAAPKPEEVAEKLGWTLGQNTKTITNDFRSSNGNARATSTPVAKPHVDFNFDNE